MHVLDLRKEPPRTQHAAEQLACHRRDGCAVDAHAAGHDEQPVQPDIQQTCPQQKIERVARISQRPQHTGRVVVQDRCRDAKEDDANIQRCVGKNIHRCVDERQQRRSPQRGRHRENHAEYHAEQYAIIEVAVQVIAAFRTEGFGHRDAEADARALHKAQNQKIQRVGAAHRRQRVGAKAPPDDDGIGEVVQLLEQCAQHQRQRENQYAGQRSPGRQIGRAGGWFFHGRNPP